MRTPILVLGLAAGFASASLVTPFTETFDNGNANWLDGPQNPATWNPGGYLQTTADVSSAGSFGLLLFRAQANQNSSGGAFVGDYAASGIDRISFDIRHDADINLSFIVRFATANNSPAFVIFSEVEVSANTWTNVSFDISPDNPLLTFAGGSYATVAPQVGNVQVLVDRVDGLTTPLVTNFDLDNVSIVPAPGAMALLGLGGLAAVRRRRA
ncbi:MAG: PEP-CTERM sorting domain-containing protein [Phycisphaerales bacterium]|nr:PEP-CTERM sorting domain-containing protein [Planctomycetota bacterium]MCH8509828.1 PEP-CTERM sorting domain-containing protein [Phycisphaerales bacterium]